MVEGISDLILFDAVLKTFGANTNLRKLCEIVSVGGKFFFDAYAKLLNACKISYAIIADLDYVADVAPEDIRVLFKSDSKNIKKDVVDNEKSMDGEALVRGLDDAIGTNDVAKLSELWEYIKARRRRLRSDLTPEDEIKLSSFIEERRRSSEYILRRGRLEDYLPDEYKSKDLKNVIDLTNEENFWALLPVHAQKEFSMIAREILGVEDH